ncbi:hypothetical protein ACVMHZ_001507 [Bradyrhizobium liaoningense]
MASNGFRREGEVEQRVGRHRPPGGIIGEPVVEEFDMAAGIERGGEAARMVRRRGRRDLAGDDVAHLRNHVGIGRGAARAKRHRHRNGCGPGEASPGDRGRDDNRRHVL